MQKSTTISFRVSKELKTRLEDRAKIENKTLSEYTKSILDSSYSERIIQKVKTDFEELDEKTKKINLIVSDARKNINDQANKFNELLTTHIQFYEQKSNEIGKNVAIFDSELENAILRLESTKKLNFWVAVFSIFSNLIIICFLVAYVFL